MADARLEGAVARVTDERVASRLQDKGAWGQRDGRGLVLDLHEAAVLVGDGRLTVDGPDGALDERALFHAGCAAFPGFAVAHAAYQDARARGLVVRRGRHGFDVLPRAARLGRTPPVAHLHPRADTDAITAAELEAMASAALRDGTEAWVAVVDGDADVTHYGVARADLRGTVAPPQGLDAALIQVLGVHAVAVEGEDALAAASLGGRIGGVHVLSLPEAAYAHAHGARVAGGRDTPAAALSRAGGDGPALAALYASLRDARCLPKAGLKFGVHFRLYTAPIGEGHAPYLVQHVPASWQGPVRELARLVRLAHSVKKRLVVATPGRHLEVRWQKI